MQNPKNIVAELAVTETLGQITRAYEETYLIKIKRTREAVLKNRLFMDSLMAVFNEVRLIYGGASLHNPKLLQERQLSSNGQTVAVLFSSNKKFSGEVTQKVYTAFYNAIRDGKSDIVIVGKSGRDLFHERAGNLKYRYFNSLEEPALLPTLRGYSTVNLFFGKFLSLVKQVETTEAIREIDYSRPAQPAVKPGDRKYIFEPSLSSVVGFFEQELFDAFFRQAAKESTLATLGSSISELEEATNQTEEKLVLLRRLVRRALRREANRKQLNILPSIIF